ncbi:hypothetical protein [Brevundimonas sp. PAMC22021]|uniref:hypothetical protein n=1 Tax=Brevundimonas sp. PAMC22021 TaxID=2861285 RepID=UPI001C62A5B4|nr:hypothetical protein [Brevundimonas sp. PAMC22021]QYF86264.1 hypothetical protein KY493_10485 [Brevundimonas sp. PAMC22021]
MTVLADRVPALNDVDLSTLRANAVRLVEEGTATQVLAADNIIPVIDAEVARRAALPKAAPVKKRAAPRLKAIPVSGHQTALAPKAA